MLLESDELSPSRCECEREMTRNGQKATQRPDLCRVYLIVIAFDRPTGPAGRMFSTWEHLNCIH